MKYDNSFATELGGLYLAAPPRGFREPTLMSFDRTLNAELGLPEIEDTVAAQRFSGTSVDAGAEPIALAYAGHQFGGFSPQLGDGRAVLLGEIVDPEGRRWDLQLKGSGPTPFSRGGDGFAAVGPVLREHLVSAAMHHLGIPTSRVLATVRTGEQVYRQTPLPGAVLARIASSHIRVGTFEFFANRRDGESLGRLLQYTVARHAPELEDHENPALALLEWVSDRQAALIAGWMGVGFVHGVMNTDNFTISGETLDYGPCAFVDTYESTAVFSSIDRQGRYAFRNQPGIAQWNLARLGESLLNFIDPDPDTAVEKVQQVLARFGQTYNTHRAAGLRAKLGLIDGPTDDTLAEDLLAWMEETEQDHTRTFRALADSLRSGDSLRSDEAFVAWEVRWRTRLGSEAPGVVAERMDAVNPLYIPRNHIVEDVLTAAESGDLEPFRRFQRVLEHPFTQQDGAERYAESAPTDFVCTTFCGT